MENNFCIFVISHGRPNNVKTIETLKKAGCTIPTYILIDNLDKTADEYISKYKSIVYIFDKNKYAKMVDNYDNFNNLRTTTHARNACFDLSKELGYTYFLVLDDDYTSFRFRIDAKMNHSKRGPAIIKNIDEIFLATLSYYKSSNFTSLCFAQGGDFLGLESSFNRKNGPKRKAMNSFFCSIHRRFYFVSTLNEDVNTYMSLGHKGYVFMTIPFINLEQVSTQKNKGGMTESYVDNGSYVKTFYTVLCRPDCTKVSLMGAQDKRIHHKINWDNAVPMIIPEKYKK
ncbi:MAG: hypothetical protein ACOYMA_22665 [Bacteroidia bacterium]